MSILILAEQLKGEVSEITYEMLGLARKLHAQGFDYMAFYATEDATSPTPRRGRWTFEKHVVNTGMALKAYAALTTSAAKGAASSGSRTTEEG